MTAQEIEENNMKAMRQFIFILWKPNPKRERVHIELDDGSISFSMKYDKFIELMQDIMAENGINQLVIDNISKLKESLCEYQGLYYYNRNNMHFAEVGSREYVEHIMPQAILAETQKTFNKDNKNNEYAQFMSNITNSYRKQKDKKHKIENPIARFFGSF